MAQPPRTASGRVGYSVLGELAVEVDGLRQPIKRRREGLILCLLIAARGAVVSADRLVAEIWADESPQNALASLQVGVSRLRAMIEPDRAPRASASRLVSAAGGYAVSAEVGEVDAWAFEAAAEECLAADVAVVQVDRAWLLRGPWPSGSASDCRPAASCAR